MAHIIPVEMAYLRFPPSLLRSLSGRHKVDLPAGTATILGKRFQDNWGAAFYIPAIWALVCSILVRHSSFTRDLLA